MRQEIFDKYKALGSIAAIELCAKFDKINLYVSVYKNNEECYEPAHYGLYSCFTNMTQWVYGTPDELLFILGVMSTHKDIIENGIYEFYKKDADDYAKAIELAFVDVLKEMKRIGHLNYINIAAETSEEAYAKYFTRSYNKFEEAANYFYFYKAGRVTFHKCEIIVANEEI